MNSDIKIFKSNCTPCDLVYRQLSEALSRGQWFPGERLPTEQVLMEMYNCSRVTLRAALNRLVKQNLIFRKQGSGTYATDVQCRPKSCNIAFIGRFISPNSKETFSLRQQIYVFSKVASQKHFMICVFMIPEHSNFFSEVERLNINLNYYDGFIFSYALSPYEVNELHERSIPFVSLTPPLQDDGTVSYVDIDNKQGAYLATNHLLEQKCQYPIMFNGSESFLCNVDKKIGFKNALEDLKIPFNLDKRVFSMDQDDDKKAIQKIKDILNDNTIHFDSIIICGNWATWGVINELRFQNKKIPEDIAIISYASADWVDKVLNLPLTTIKQPIEEQISRSLELLRHLIYKNFTNCIIQTIQPSLIIRKSSLKCF